MDRFVCGGFGEKKLRFRTLVDDGLFFILLFSATARAFLRSSLFAASSRSFQRE